MKLAAVQIQNLLKIRTGFASVESFDELYTILFERFMSDMPYGTAKARTGDPIEWLDKHIAQMPTDKFNELIAAL